MAKPVFTLRDRKGNAIAEREYTPITVEVAGVTHALALHKIGSDWYVSHPTSGARVCAATRYSDNGIRVRSNGMGVREAKPLAIIAVGVVAARVGPAEFNAALAGAA